MHCSPGEASCDSTRFASSATRLARSELHCSPLLLQTKTSEMGRVVLFASLFAVASGMFSPDGNVAMLAICDEKDPAQQRL
jgi:hypothetical protein